MGVLNLPPDVLEKQAGDQGKYFVAMDGDTAVVTASFRIIELNVWINEWLYTSGIEKCTKNLAGTFPLWKSSDSLKIFSQASKLF